MEYSRRRLEPFRTHRHDAVREYAGAHYSDDGADDRVPINMLELAVNIYMRQLAARAPQALVTTTYRELKATAADMAVELNHRIRAMKLGDTLQEAVLNALFSIGIVKCGITQNGTIALDGQQHAVGESFAESIDLDDWVHDASAKRWDRLQFAGDRYSVALEEAKDADYYDKKVRESLTAMSIKTSNEQGDPRINSVSGGDSVAPDEYRDRVELWDIWLPEEKKIVVLSGESSIEKPLAVIDWDGPDAGPYHYLSYGRVPGNMMPLAPVANLRDLHELANRLFRKLGRQAERQKTILGVGPGADQDAERVIHASDGEAIRMDSPEKVKEYSFGGPENVSLAFTLQLRDMFSYHAGNLDSLGGLSPQADTVGQEKLLDQSSSKRIADLQDRTVEFTAGVIKALAWYEWTEPIREENLQKKVPGTDIYVPVIWSAETRTGDYLDYNFNIDPYSMRHESPSEKLQTIMNVWQQYIAPFAPQMAEQGIVPNFATLLKILGQYSNTPELEDILSYADPPEPVAGGPRGNPRPSSTTRRYERVNRPGATEKGKNTALTQALLGGGLQDSQAASIGRPTG